MIRPRAYNLPLLLFSKNKTFIRQLKKLLGFFPLHPHLYETALRHRSASVFGTHGRINNERLEFLGDSVLDTVISEYLYQKFPNKDEGFLTRMRAQIVQRKSMNTIAVSMGLPQMILMDSNRTKSSDKIYGNALEALIGAIYIDRSYQAARYFIIKHYLPKINFNEIIGVQYDCKSKLYHLIQDKKWDLLIDTQENIEENEHATHFLSSIIINGKYISEGKGWTKKEAEQNAASNALEKVNT